MLWGSPIELSNQAQLKNRIKESLLKNRRILSAYNLTERDLSKHVRFLERYKPEYLYGYATILTVFAKMLDDANIKPQLSLKAVVSTSETLEKWQEDLIARVFDCPVANEYGTRDAGILAYTCPSGGIHITAENCIIEVLDPVTYEPVLNGQSGVLAITDLTNYVQPRLRYMLGDMGTLSTEECCCGRRLPLVPIIEKELLQRREEQMQNQKLYRKSYDTNYLDFVFVNDMGTLFKPDYITRHFEELLQRNKLKVIRVHDLRHPYVKHTTKIFSLRLMDFQAQAYPDARRKTRGACQLHRGGQSRSPVRPLCNRKRFSCLPPQAKMSWILYAISMRLSGYTSTRSISSSASSVVSVSASKIALDASLRLSCRACSSCFCFACANTAA